MATLHKGGNDDDDDDDDDDDIIIIIIIIQCAFHLNFPVCVLPVRMEMKFARRIGCAHPISRSNGFRHSALFPTVCLFNAFWAKTALVKSIVLQHHGYTLPALVLQTVHCVRIAYIRGSSYSFNKH